MNRAAPEPKHNMGEPVPRIEARLKVTGEALYPSDYAVRNPAFAFLVTRSIARGRIAQMDLADALAVPGVLDILMHENTRLKGGKRLAGRSAIPNRAPCAGDWLIGWGCASAVYPTHVGAAAARVRLLASGEARVQIAAHEIGTGVRTVVAQMAADRLGIPVSRVTVETGDSTLPPSPVAGGSNQTASCCSVVMKACDHVRRKLYGTTSETVGGSGSGEVTASGNLEDAFKRLKL